MKILLNQKEINCSLNKAYTTEDKILTLVNNFEKRVPIILGDMKFSLKKEVADLFPLPGILMLTSGSMGKRSWILHPWNNLIKRVKSQKEPQYRCLIFLSLDHAAAIEGFFSHYFNDVDCGVFNPSLPVSEVLLHCNFHNPEAISTTPSTFLRFISYPELRLWIKNNIKEIKLGGEEISLGLQELIKKEFRHIAIRSIFGTTETWSINTETGDDLSCHKITDKNVTIKIENNELYISSPYLFSHSWNGEVFTPREGEVWKTGDIVEVVNENEFKFKSRTFLKYHGLKIFPHEWEEQIIEEFKISWAQVIPTYELDAIQYFSMNLPLQMSSREKELKQMARNKKWPIFSWSFSDNPLTNKRGKRASSGWTQINELELKQIYENSLNIDFKYSYLEDYTWNDNSCFLFFQLKSGFIFYKLNPCRLSLQYRFSDLDEFENALNDLTDEVIIRLPSEIFLKKEKFHELGEYYVWSLNLNDWKPITNKYANLEMRYENTGSEFDRYLTGSEKMILSTLSDASIFYSKTEDKVGLCAFRLIDKTYHGFYLFNNGFSVRDFLKICSQGLWEAKKLNFAEAIVRVDEQNSAAKFIHETLGFTKTKKNFRLWRNRIDE